MRQQLLPSLLDATTDPANEVYQKICCAALPCDFNPKPTSQVAFIKAGRFVIGIKLCELIPNDRRDLLLGTVAHQALSLQLDRQQCCSIIVVENNKLRCVGLVVDQRFCPFRWLVAWVP